MAGTVKKLACSPAEIRYFHSALKTIGINFKVYAVLFLEVSPGA